MRFRELTLALLLFPLLASHTARADGDEQNDAGCRRDHGGISAENSAWSLQVLNLTKMAKNLAGYKSDEAVDRYIACWTRPPSVDYEKKYRKMIKAAADASGVPFSILACLFFRESRWNPSIKSDANPPAVGLAQLRPDTWRAIQNHLSAPVGARNPNAPANLRVGVKRDGSELDRIVAKIEGLYKTSFKMPGGISDPQHLALLKSWLLEYQRKRRSPSAGSADQYLSNIESALTRIEIREIYAKYVKEVGRKPAALVATNPEASIIFGAAYLKAMVYPGIFEKDRDYRFPSHDRWVIATGGYNSGPAASKCDGDMSAEECIVITARGENERHENSRHMLSIKNCSEHGNKDPMPGDSGKGCGA